MTWINALLSSPYLHPAASGPPGSWSGRRCSAAPCCRCRRPCWRRAGARRAPQRRSRPGSPPRRPPPQTSGWTRGTTRAAPCSDSPSVESTKETHREIESAAGTWRKSISFVLLFIGIYVRQKPSGFQNTPVLVDLFSSLSSMYYKICKSYSTMHRITTHRITTFDCTHLIIKPLNMKMSMVGCQTL